MPKTVFADESYKPLDELTSRTIFCYAEFNSDESMAIARVDIKSKILSDDVRFNMGNEKTHYCNFNPHQKSLACDIISKLDYRCKVFVQYDHGININENNAAHKVELLKKSVSFMLDKQLPTGSSLYIEHAKGIYTKSNMPDDVQMVGSDSEDLFLIPDIILGVFCDYLDKKVRGAQASTNYSLIREKIRLQVISAGSYEPAPLSRNARL